ncbi:short chain dehydrogenase domain-containing protein [Ditylenchus destructor]|uniref:Short chain dehydrogenase domain-containing protein n=1 Tax=Ditylenchus destructor TaxID=166010 RepID=A0AAD4NED6_9BILA|nr:short chain dehydrogenase domain-containing protein [Ditylenchus destructor]
MSKKVFVVTGSNKGIGYGIVRGLAEKVADSVIYLTARNTTLGDQALKKVHEELGAKKKSEILFHQLDITDEVSCQKLASHLKEKHGAIDVLINNAAIAFDEDEVECSEQQVELTFSTNYYGPKTVSRYLVPLIKSGGRLINICSSLGMMKNKYSIDRIEKFKGTYTEADVDGFVEDYKRACKEGNRTESGFPKTYYPAYQVSKAAEIAYTLLQSAELKHRSIIVNACCPGYVATDLNNHKGQKTIEEGADNPIYLTTDQNIPNGKFVIENRKVIEWP